MKKIITTLLLLVVCLHFTMAMGVLKYQVLRPATKPLPKDVKTMAFVYRNVHFPADSITKYYKLNDQLFLDTTTYTQKIVKAVYMGFRSEIAEAYPLDTIPLLVMDKKEEKTNARSIEPLRWEVIDEIGKKHRSDIIISLEDISVFNNYETWFDGAVYNGIADVTAYYEWTIYDPLTQAYIYKERKVDTLQSYEKSYDEDRLIRDKMPKRSQIMEVVGYTIGERLAHIIAPKWETIARYYYDRGNRELREASDKVQGQKWEDALKIWKQIAKEEVSRNGARAVFNMGVVYERQGALDKAIESVKKSKDIYKILDRYADEFEFANLYLEVLQERKAEVVKLDAQQIK